MRDSCRKVERCGGPDAILNRKQRLAAAEELQSPLAVRLYLECLQQGRTIQVRTAQRVAEDLTRYVTELDMPDVLSADMLQEAVRRVRKPVKKELILFLQITVANLACEKDQSLVILAKKIELERLPRLLPNGEVQRVECKFPRAVFRAKKALDKLRSWIAPPDFVEDAEEIWKRANQCGSLDAAVEEMGKEQAIEWLKSKGKAGSTPLRVLRARGDDEMDVVLAA